MPFVPLQEKEIPLAIRVPFATSLEMQVTNYGSTQSNCIQSGPGGACHFCLRGKMRDAGQIMSG